MVAAQIIMGITIVAMVSGKVPIYLTAFVGSIIAALAAGFGISPGFMFGHLGGTAVFDSNGNPQFLANLLAAGLNAVIIDMLGVLLFIGIMEKVGFLNAIVVKVMHFGNKMGGGPGVCTAGGIAAGIIGGMTGFTQPAITGVITGPPAVDMGVDKNKVAGVLAHAGHLGNFGGFTHPTMIAVIATAGITFGAINVIGAVVALSIFAASFIRLRRDMKGVTEMKELSSDIKTDIPFGKAITPFIVLVTAFVIGIPVVVSGLLAAFVVVMITGKDFIQGEKTMMEGLTRIIVPLFATASFLFMSRVISEIGLVTLFSNLLEPILAFSPILIMLLVSSLAGFFTQSNAASIPIIIPFLLIVLDQGANPLAAAVAAAGGPAIMQYYLTGGPVAALSTVVPVIEGSDLKTANKFQRPSILVGMAVLFVICLVLSIVL